MANNWRNVFVDNAFTAKVFAGKNNTGNKSGFWFGLLLLCLLCQPVQAAIVVHEFTDPKQEARYQALINDFRCPTCQNQNLAGSDAPIAMDLKQKTYEMIQAGQSDSEIRTFMLQRYGDFISYRPPVRPSTWILWFFPPLLLVWVLLAWVWVQKRRLTKTHSVNPTAPLNAAEEARVQALLQHHSAANKD